MLLPPSCCSISGLEFERIKPVAAKRPGLLFLNTDLAREFNFPEGWTRDPDYLARIFSGSELINQQTPIALAYAGHQFGGLSPQLGDGRAHLLGELQDSVGECWEVQLKGSGPTRYSRNGDGRCGLGPAVREYIMSEALHALGVPTCRSLAVVATGETIWREGSVAGAVVTRLARSHIRVGSFEFYAIRGQHDVLQALADYTIQRHYPSLNTIDGPDRYISLLDQVIERQIKLIVEWLRIGFIHGVMNTDNTLLSGDTIDYGPCAMLGSYDPETVYSSIDRGGRYAFGQQHHIAQWNMARFAETLLPLLHKNPKQGIPLVEPIIYGFPEHFDNAYYAMMAAKLGLAEEQTSDRHLVDELLAIMLQEKLDYTRTFVELMQSLEAASNWSQSWPDSLIAWFPRWQQRIDNQAGGVAAARELMGANNPLVIPRNHHVEQALTACEAGDLSVADRFLKVLRQPYQQLAETADYQDPPEDGDRYYRTFCGT